MRVRPLTPVKQEHLHIVSLNHRNTTIDQVGRLHVPEDRQQAFLTGLKEQLGVRNINDVFESLSPEPVASHPCPASLGPPTWF